MVWLFCAIFNIVDFVSFLLTNISKHSKVNYGWALFFSIFALLLGPVWTLGVIYYKGVIQ